MMAVGYLSREEEKNCRKEHWKNVELYSEVYCWKIL